MLVLLARKGKEGRAECFLATWSLLLVFLIVSFACSFVLLGEPQTRKKRGCIPDLRLYVLARVRVLYSPVE
jgi:hypothetical protein